MKNHSAENRFGVLALAAIALGAAISGPAVASDRYEESEPISIAGWEKCFGFSYDYVLVETAGLNREFEPVEVTLSVPDAKAERWYEHIRVVRLDSNDRGRLVPHQTLQDVSAVAAAVDKAQVPAPARSVNVIFLARCPARAEVTYRLFWGMPDKLEASAEHLPTACVKAGLEVGGELPALSIRNEHYAIELDKKSGAIWSARRAGHGQDETMSMHQNIPIHFGTDAWSPPATWDHDFNWPAPPNQKRSGGAIALRYHRWGPMHSFRDVIASITYTFYAHVPYVHVSSTIEFTADRSTRAVRIGEIVVSHPARPGVGEQDGGKKIPEIFSHFAWPAEDGRVIVREINAHQDAEGWANVPGLARGALGVLDRDIPWVAGYHLKKGYGIAALRRSQFVGNRLGGPIPHTAPCTYVAKYHMEFSYWSRPMVYPLGLRGTPLDQNTAIAAGAFFATEEALLIFEPDATLGQVVQAHREFTKPLRLRYKGTGPW